MNPQRVFSQTEKQIKQMNIILKRLMPEDDKHTIIAGATKIEVIPETLMTFKIACAKREPPCKIWFSYPAEVFPKDMDVFVSIREEKPTAATCDQRAQGPRIINVELPLGQKSKLFKNEFIYVSLCSAESMSTTIRPKFADEPSL